MTPLQLANSECANLRNSTCQGIGIRDDLSLSSDPEKPKPIPLFRLWKPKPCDVATCRCCYFEDSVAPAIRMMDQGPKRDSWTAAITSYLRKIKSIPARLAAKRNIFGLSPDDLDLSKAHPCQVCGKPVQGSKRFCPICARSRKNSQSNGCRTEKPAKTGVANQDVMKVKEGGPLL